MAIVWLIDTRAPATPGCAFILQAYSAQRSVDSDGAQRRGPRHPPQGRRDQPRRGRVRDRQDLDFRGLRAIRSRQSRAFVYILRHPKDVLLSYLSYLKSRAGAERR